MNLSYRVYSCVVFVKYLICLFFFSLRLVALTSAHLTVTPPILLLLPALLSLIPSIDHIAASAAHPLGENRLKLGPAVPAPQQGSPKQVDTSL